MNRRDAIALSAGVGMAAVLFNPASAGSVKSTELTVPELTKVEDLIDGLFRWIADQELDGLNDDIVLSRDQYRQLRLNNRIDWLALNGDADENDPVETTPFFDGHRVRVPGSALA